MAGRAVKVKSYTYIYTFDGLYFADFTTKAGQTVVQVSSLSKIVMKQLESVI